MRPRRKEARHNLLTSHQRVALLLLHFAIPQQTNKQPYPSFRELHAPKHPRILKSAPRQKGNKANGKGDKNAAATTGEAPVKPVAGKANAAATQAVKAEATVPAAPTREVRSAGKNANKNAKTVKNTNDNATPAKLRSKQHVPHNVGMAFLLQLVVGLAPEKRSTCQILREILSHESHGRLVLTPTSKGLQPAFGAVASDSDDWATVRQEQLRQMARQAQSDKFQEAMQQLGGEHLYDAIRAQLKQVGGASVWETNKDKPALQAKNIRPRSGSADKSAKPQKDAGGQKQQQQTAKKNGPQVQSVKKNLPMEAEKFGQLPPPAPVTAKSANRKKEAVPTKKEATPVKKEAVPIKKEATPVKKEIKKETAPKNKGQQAKNSAPEKNAAPVKNVTAGAIVNNARGGRATVSKAN
ncbi:hypothetical protein V7S43_016959 [Phytophthora oleae]|uniref:Uncharacterized protein n=1 Tax=Phytophthora oleae TaxID=2107226 RepID=A0ABD3EUX1_9STRA